MGVAGQRHVPAALPPEMTRYPLHRGLGRPQGQSGRALKKSPPPGFNPRTVQLVASCYTDYASPTPHYSTHHINIPDLSLSAQLRIYKHNEIKITLNGQITQSVEINKGAGQGFSLSLSNTIQHANKRDN